VTADDKKADKKDAKEGGSGQIWAAVITALATIVVGLITLYGTLRVTDSRIVTGPESPGPTVTRTVTVGPTATVTETVNSTATKRPSAGPTKLPAADKTADDVTWETTLQDYNYGDRIGLTARFDCPPRGVPQWIAGDGLYAEDSSICTAAVYDGRISLSEGGAAVIKVREGASSYEGGKQNGIESDQWDAGRDTSFEFVPPR
jgi:hypothetical protein